MKPSSSGTSSSSCVFVLPVVAALSLCDTHNHSLTYSLINYSCTHYGRLVEDVLGDNSSTGNTNSNNKVPMEKVVMLIWQFRDDPSVITFMARFMTKVRTVGEKVPIDLIVVVCVGHSSVTHIMAHTFFDRSFYSNRIFHRWPLWWTGTTLSSRVVSTRASAMCWMVLNFTYRNWHI